jgi:hypothetical protein
MNSVYVISLTIAIILVIGIFLYIIFRHNEKFSIPAYWAEALEKVETSVAADQAEFAKLYIRGFPTPPAYHTKLYKHMNQISAANLVSGYEQTIGSRNGIHAYTLVNITSSGNISNVNISITSDPGASEIPIGLYTSDKKGILSYQNDTVFADSNGHIGTYESINTTNQAYALSNQPTSYNYTPPSPIPPGGSFVITAAGFLGANANLTFTINSITFK